MMARMIATIVQTGFRSLRRDRVAFILSFVLPVAFFTIFGFVFGNMRSSSTPRVSVLVVDEDKSSARAPLSAACSVSLLLMLPRIPSQPKETPRPRTTLAPQLKPLSAKAKHPPRSSSL